MAKVVDVNEVLSQLSPSIRKKISTGSTVEINKQETPSIRLNHALKGGFAYGRQILI